MSREIKDEEEEGLSLTYGVFMTRDLLQAPVHSKRKLVSLKNSAERQKTLERLSLLEPYVAT